MNDRLLKVQLLQIALLTTMMLGGIPQYNNWAAVPIVLSELGFLISLLFPLDFARAQLPLVGGWLIGALATMSAIAIAGDPRVYVWAVAPVSIQFIGVIWTRKLTVAASVSIVLLVTATALLFDRDALDEHWWVLLPCFVVTILTAAAATTLRDVENVTRGAVLVDEGAVSKLRAHGTSLLPIGVTEVQGEFVRGDVIAVRNTAGEEIARGLANYSAAEARLIARHASSQIEGLLGYANEPEMIHRDNLVLG